MDTSKFVPIIKRRISNGASKLLIEKLYTALNQPFIVKKVWEKIGAPIQYDEHKTLKDNIVAAYGLSDIENTIESVNAVNNFKAFFEVFLSPTREFEEKATQMQFLEGVAELFTKSIEDDLYNHVNSYYSFESDCFFETYEFEADQDDWRARDQEASEAWDSYSSTQAFEDHFQDDMFEYRLDNEFSIDEYVSTDVIGPNRAEELASLFCDVDFFEAVEDDVEDDDEDSYYRPIPRISLESLLDRIVDAFLKQYILGEESQPTVVLQTKLSFVIACDTSNDYASGAEIVKHLSKDLELRLFSKLKRSAKLQHESGVDVYLYKPVKFTTQQVEFSPEEQLFVTTVSDDVRHLECLLSIYNFDESGPNYAVVDLLPQENIQFRALRILIDSSLNLNVVTSAHTLQIGPLHPRRDFWMFESQIRNLFSEIEHENAIALKELEEISREESRFSLFFGTTQPRDPDSAKKAHMVTVSSNNCVCAEICFVSTFNLCLNLDYLISSRQDSALTFTVPCHDVRTIYVSVRSLELQRELDREFSIESFECASSVLERECSFDYDDSNNIFANKTEDGRRAAYVFNLESKNVNAREIPSKRNIFTTSTTDGRYTKFKSTIFYPMLKEKTEAPTRFMNYIGFKNPQNEAFYKDSNYLAYIYLYMYMPQVINRFQEHLQNDEISQQAPLAAAMNCYISSDIADNPQRFLREALALAKKGHHPLYRTDTSGYRGYGPRALVDFQKLMGSEQQERKYHVLFGYMYSFCDYYTRPLAILYNALWAKSQDTSVRSNPILREDVRNLAGNFNISKFVETYNECIQESQDADFVKSSFFRSLTSESATVSDIENELEYFINNARVWEHSELALLGSHFDKTPTEELPKTIRPEVRAVYGDLFEYIDRSSTNLPDADVFLDAKGETLHTRFSKELTFCLSVVSKFWAFTMGPMLTDGLYETPFWKKFIEGSMPNVVSHIVDISGLFNFAILSKSLEKIKKDDFVKIAGGEQERLSQTNKVKNIMPYAGIRDSLRTFDRKPPYSYLGLDGSQPKASRLPLGAFLSIFSWIRYAEKNAISDMEYGATQTDMDVLKVYQPTFDTEEGFEDSPFEASSASIKKRLERLSSKYTICIGENEDYVRDAINTELEVFVFMSPEGTNISTLGIYMDNNGDAFVYDAKGQNNRSPYSLGDKAQCIAMVKWFEGLFFKYCVEEKDNDLEQFIKLRIAGDDAADDFEFNIEPLQLKDGEGFVEELFEHHGSFLPSESQTIEQACGAASRTTELLYDALPKEYTQEQLKSAKDALIEAGQKISCEFFELLFQSRYDSTDDKSEDVLKISKDLERRTEEYFTPIIRALR